MTILTRFCRFGLVFLFAIMGLASITMGQTETATISGLITDEGGGTVPDCEVLLLSVERGTVTTVRTNDAGIYLFTSVQPGSYSLTVRRGGFKQVDLLNVIVNVQDHIQQNFRLQVGSVSESITVTAGTLNVNTTDGAVSTVIDRQFVEDLPLNGRSFNTLLQLTPGVVITSQNGNASLTGQFSIAGQRTDTNNFLIDGVSANFGVVSTPVATGSGTGTSQAFSALGGTSSLVSVEALQEFRIETSSFAPEFGRSPGGQVVLVTRSGTNDFHGGLYDYFRNTVMDANDWFANQAGKPRAPEHHNDFGGYGGGPIRKDKTFFFVSYEGARLQEPQTSLIHVPSSDVRTSPTTPSQLVPILDAYPLPNGPVSPGDLTAQFTGTFSDMAVLNAGSIRIDHKWNDRFTLFGRFSDAPSQLLNRVGGLSTLESVTVDTLTLTIGLNMQFGNGMLNTLRGNYSTQKANSTYRLDSFAGAVPVDSGVFLAPLAGTGNQFLFQTYDTAYLEQGQDARNQAKQMEFADDLSLTSGAHLLKFGGDYRGIFLNLRPSSYSVSYNATSVESLLSTGATGLFTLAEVPSRVLSQSVSIYAQDVFRISSRLVLTYGLRWEIDPAPAALGSTKLAAWTDVDNPPKLAPAPFGSPLWETTWWNFAPRVGLAWSLNAKGDLVFRAGAGIFYDPGVSAAASVAASFPNSASDNYRSAPVPIGNLNPYLPVLSLAPPYPNGISAYDPNLALPRSYQWSMALEKSLGGSQALSLTYAGQAGRQLLRQEAIYQPNENFPGEDFLLTKNDARSNYSSLQLQYRRSLVSGLQALANYTWSHSLDNASNDVAAGLPSNLISGATDYASSDFDVRQSFSAALTYDVPAAVKSEPLSYLARDWSLAAVIVARTGFPFNAVVVGTSPDKGGFAYTRPDIVAGQPFWISDPAAPGGKMLNVNAFAVPTTIRQGTEGRNDIPGFGLTQVDLSLGRRFAFGERLKLSFRADAFNVLNHPNFTNPYGAFQFGPFYLQSVQMLNQGLGGLNPLFQEGGPRSLQLSLQLRF